MCACEPSTQKVETGGFQDQPGLKSLLLGCSHPSDLDDLAHVAKRTK